MIAFNPNFFRVGFALFVTPLIIHAADMEILPGNAVRVRVGANTSPIVAVDVSSDLASWRQMTNVASVAGQVTFANDPLQSEPARFFRIADGDETFAIAGYVSGGQYFGGRANVAITHTMTGATVQTDANGFFHFDNRFSRTNLPLTLTASADGVEIAQRRIVAANAGTFIDIQAPLGPLVSFDPTDTTCIFKITGGPRAGLEYTIRFYDDRFTISGDLTGEGTFAAGLPQQPIQCVLDTSQGRVTNEFFMWPGDTNSWFSGIPGTNGTLAGNGTATVERVTVSPNNLSGMAFAIGEGDVQFGATSFILRQQDNTFIVGSYSAWRDGNFWNVTMLDADGSATRVLSLYFLSATNGRFKYLSAGVPLVSGNMRQIEYTRPPEGTVPAPATLSSIVVTTETAGIGSGARYTVAFSGGTSGVFQAAGVEGQPFGSGTYTYTPFGTQAHLNMMFTQFPGDYDDMILTFDVPAGSGGVNRFSGTQRVSPTVYPFTGTFAY